MHTTTIHPDVNELARIMRGAWPYVDEQIVASGHPTNEGEGDGGGGDGGGGSGDGGDGGGNGGDGGGGDGGAGGGDGDDKVTMSKADHDNLQRQLREQSTERKKLADEKAERERKEAENKGEYEKIAAQEKERADAAEARALKVERANRVSRIASRLKFRDPDDVRLADDVLDDDSKVEKALKDIAKSKPYLITDGEKPKQGNVNGGDGGGDDAPIAGQARLARHYASTGGGT